MHEVSENFREIINIFANVFGEQDAHQNLLRLSGIPLVHSIEARASSHRTATKVLAHHYQKAHKATVIR
jgi:hypothetical protein